MPSANPISPVWKIYGNQPLQAPFDVAVVMPTILRPSILEAVKSIFAQTNVPRIQLLIGIDAPLGDFSSLDTLLSAAPDHVTPCLFYPGYSTSVRHGGPHLARDGGALRCTLSYLANARHVAYLDDDNSWTHDHLSGLLRAISGCRWAYAYRWFLHPQTRKKICVDSWESVGPGQGIFGKSCGGWVDPNCLMIDKLACEPALRWWNIPIASDENGMSADRHVYRWLQENAGVPGHSDLVSVHYLMQENDPIHQLRLSAIGDHYPKP